MPSWYWLVLICGIGVGGAVVVDIDAVGFRTLDGKIELLVPRGPSQDDGSRARFGRGGDVQQPQFAAHFLRRKRAQG